jgi:hypothetical protein
MKIDKVQWTKLSFMLKTGSYIFSDLIKSRYLPLSLIVLGFVVRLPILTKNLFEEHSFRQTQTAWVARDFFRNGIDIFSYPLQIFGPKTNIPFEMPLFQSIVAMTTTNVGNIEITGRTIGLVFFLFSA